MKKIFALMLVVCFASLGCDDKKAETKKSTGSGSAGKEAPKMKEPTKEDKHDDKKEAPKVEEKKEAPKVEEKKEAPKVEEKGPKIEKK